jgi:hypothetical protein
MKTVTIILVAAAGALAAFAGAIPGASKIHHGSAAVSKVYRGGGLIWSAGPAVPFAWYKLDDNAESADVADFAENPSAAVLPFNSSSVASTGADGGAFALPETGSVTLPAKVRGLSGGGAYTVSFLSRRDSEGHIGLFHANFDNGGTPAYELVTYWNQDNGQWWTWCAGVGPVGAYVPFPVGEWRHFAITHSAGTVRFYYNGVEALVTQGYAAAPWTDATAFGGDTGFCTKHADDLRFYDVALSAAEVQALFAGYALPEPPPPAPTLTFDACGGSVDPASVALTDGLPYGANNGGAFPAPYLEGYFFGGWYTEAGGSGSRVYPEDYYYGSSDVTLYAYWYTE